ncbi:endonuclease VII domain-containing protein [Streptomyces sp. NPDC002928]|uniref:endonuclease VII domain-containing protein n=1 Tax=Streptomyces sp. NPDC002928 TaxID=3154440 RepID=UPI0033B0F522
MTGRKRWAKQQEYSRAYKARLMSTPEGRAELALRRRLHRYKMTRDEYAALTAAAENRCMICGNEETAVDGKGNVKTLSVDHCHETGRIRGLLCNTCNRAIGLLRDSPTLLREAAKYLEGS